MYSEEFMLFIGVMDAGLQIGVEAFPFGTPQFDVG
jgi:hypothetical protein